MPGNGCCVPWCKKPGKSKFGVPKYMLDSWEDALNLKLKSSMKICELHFDSNDVRRTWESGHGAYKIKVDLLRPRLKHGAIPKHWKQNDILARSTEFLNFPSSNKKKELKDYRIVLHDHSYCIKTKFNLVTMNLPTINIPRSHTSSSLNEYLMSSNPNFSESLSNKIMVEPLSITSKNIYSSNNSLLCNQTEVNKLLISCSCCSRGIDFGNLIQCSSCYNIYHYLCHIPSIKQIKTKQLLNKSMNGLNISNQSDFIDHNISNWTCTLCIDLKLLCKKISKKDSSNTNYTYENAVMKNIVLKLYCQANDSMYFRTYPDRRLFPSYYDKIKDPISLDDIKMKLNKKNTYKQFLHLIQDIKLLISNATQFYPKNSCEYNSAINLQTTFRMNLREVCDYLIKYTNKNKRNKQIKHLCSSTSLVKNEFFRPGVVNITTKPFSESDVKYLIETTNNFMHEDIFKKKFLQFLIKDRFNNRTKSQLLRKLYELQMKYKGVNNIVSNSLNTRQPLQSLENVYVSKPQPFVNNFIEVKKHKCYSKADIEYLCQETYNYNSLLIHDDVFLQSLIDDRFNDRTMSELRSKLLLLENNFLNDIKNEQNHVNFDCIRI